MIEKQLHVLIIPSWFPTDKNSSGNFIKEQAEALGKKLKVSVFLFEFISFRNYIKNLFDKTLNNKYTAGTCFTSAKVKTVFIFPTFLIKKPLDFQKKIILMRVWLKLKVYCFFNGKPDLIHHHGITNNVFITNFIHKKFNIPYAYTEHSPLESKIINFLNLYDSPEEVDIFLKLSGARIAVSEYYAKKYQQIFCINFEYVPNMVDAFFTQKALPAFPKKTNPFQFINIANFSDIKNHRLLINAFYHSFKDISNVNLIIIGEGKRRKKIEALIEELNIKGKVILKGHLSRTEVLNNIDMANISVISSTKETFCVSIAENLVRGNPALSTKCGGPEELINKENGILCENNNLNELIKGFTKIYQDYLLYDFTLISKQAKLKYAEDVIVNKLIDIYEDVIIKKKV